MELDQQRTDTKFRLRFSKLVANFPKNCCFQQKICFIKLAGGSTFDPLTLRTLSQPMSRYLGVATTAHRISVL